MKKREDGKTGRRDSKQSVFGPTRSVVSNVRLLALGSAMFIPCFKVYAQPPDVGPAQPKVALPVQEKVDLSTPALAVKSFVAAWNRQDAMQAAQCVVDGKTEENRMFSLFKARNKNDFPQFALSEPRVRHQGDSAVALLYVKTILPTPNGPVPDHPLQAERVLLRRINGQWKVMGNTTLKLQDPATVAQPPGLEPGSGILTFIATALVDPGILERARGDALRTMCQGHLKKLALAAIMLAENNEQIFAITQAAQKPNPKGMNEVLQALLNAPFQKALYPYTEDAKVFFCPLRIDAAENNEAQGRRDKLMDGLGLKRTGEPYSFNMHLDGVALANIKEPSRVVLFYEGKDGKLDFRHERKANVAFADGHVKPVDENEAKQLIWDPKGKVND